jgi:hypothetical protein
MNQGINNLKKVQKKLKNNHERSALNITGYNTAQTQQHYKTPISAGKFFLREDLINKNII